MNERKACVSCRHLSGAMCERAASVEWDPVFGYYPNATSARAQRKEQTWDATRCGPEGRFFEPRKTFFAGLVGLFKGTKSDAR